MQNVSPSVTLLHSVDIKLHCQIDMKVSKISVPIPPCGLVQDHRPL